MATSLADLVRETGALPLPAPLKTLGPFGSKIERPYSQLRELHRHQAVLLEQDVSPYALVECANLEIQPSHWDEEHEKKRWIKGNATPLNAHDQLAQEAGGYFDDRATIFGYWQGKRISSVPVGRRWYWNWYQEGTPASFEARPSLNNWGNHRSRTAARFANLVDIGSDEPLRGAWNAVLMEFASGNVPMDNTLIANFSTLVSYEVNDVRFIFRLAVLYVTALLAEKTVDHRGRPRRLALNQVQRANANSPNVNVVSTVQELRNSMQDGVRGINFVPTFYSGMVEADENLIDVLWVATQAQNPITRMAEHHVAHLLWPEIPNLRINLKVGYMPGPLDHLDSDQIWQATARYCRAYSSMDLMKEAVSYLMIVCASPGPSHFPLAYCNQLTVALPHANMGGYALGVLLAPPDYMPATDFAEFKFELLAAQSVLHAKVFSACMASYTWPELGFFHEAQELDARDRRNCRDAFYLFEGGSTVWGAVQDAMSKVGVKGDIGRLLGTSLPANLNADTLMDVLVLSIEHSVQWEELLRTMENIPSSASVWAMLYPLRMAQPVSPGQWVAPFSGSDARTDDEAFYTLAGLAGVGIELYGRDGTGLPSRRLARWMLAYNGRLLDNQGRRFTTRTGVTYEPVVQLNQLDENIAIASPDHVMFNRKFYIDSSHVMLPWQDPILAPRADRRMDPSIPQPPQPAFGSGPIHFQPWVPPPVHPNPRQPGPPPQGQAPFAHVEEVVDDPPAPPSPQLPPQAAMPETVRPAQTAPPAPPVEDESVVPPVQPVLAPGVTAFDASAHAQGPVLVMSFGDMDSFPDLPPPGAPPAAPAAPPPRASVAQRMQRDAVLQANRAALIVRPPGVTGTYTYNVDGRYWVNNRRHRLYYPVGGHATPQYVMPPVDTHVQTRPVLQPARPAAPPERPAQPAAPAAAPAPPAAPAQRLSTAMPAQLVPERPATHATPSAAPVLPQPAPSPAPQPAASELVVERPPPPTLVPPTPTYFDLAGLTQQEWTEHMGSPMDMSTPYRAACLKFIMESDEPEMARMLTRYLYPTDLSSLGRNTPSPAKIVWPGGATIIKGKVVGLSQAADKAFSLVRPLLRLRENRLSNNFAEYSGSLTSLSSALNTATMPAALRMCIDEFALEWIASLRDGIPDPRLPPSPLDPSMRGTLSFVDAVVNWLAELNFPRRYQDLRPELRAEMAASYGWLLCVISGCRATATPKAQALAGHRIAAFRVAQALQVNPRLRREEFDDKYDEVEALRRAQVDSGCKVVVSIVTNRQMVDSNGRPKRTTTGRPLYATEKKTLYFDPRDMEEAARVKLPPEECIITTLVPDTEPDGTPKLEGGRTIKMRLDSIKVPLTQAEKDGYSQLGWPLPPKPLLAAAQVPHLNRDAFFASLPTSNALLGVYETRVSGDPVPMPWIMRKEVLDNMYQLSADHLRAQLAAVEAARPVPDQQIADADRNSIAALHEAQATVETTLASGFQPAVAGEGGTSTADVQIPSVQTQASDAVEASSEAVDTAGATRPATISPEASSSTPPRTQSTSAQSSSSVLASGSQIAGINTYPPTATRVDVLQGATRVHAQPASLLARAARAFRTVTTQDPPVGAQLSGSSSSRVSAPHPSISPQNMEAVSRVLRVKMLDTLGLGRFSGN